MDDCVNLFWEIKAGLNFEFLFQIAKKLVGMQRSLVCSQTNNFLIIKNNWARLSQINDQNLFHLPGYSINQGFTGV